MPKAERAARAKEHDAVIRADCCGSMAPILDDGKPGTGAVEGKDRQKAFKGLGLISTKRVCV